MPNYIPYSSLTKSFLLESNLYNFSSSYNLIFLLSLTTISHISIYHTYYKYYISQNIYIFTISILLKRCQTLILKALLMEGMNFYY